MGGASTERIVQRFPSSWETFTVERTVSTGEIDTGSFVTLRANDGVHFLMAQNAGGGAVTAESMNRAQWESLAVEFVNASLLQLRTLNGHYLTAESGGGRELVANRARAREWETFRLTNRSRRVGILDGDQVSLQAWNGKFIAARLGGGTTLSASANRPDPDAVFTIRKSGGGNIAPGDRVSLRCRNGLNYVIAENGGGGTVQAVSTQMAEWETFRIESPEANPIPYSVAASVPFDGNLPISLPTTRVTGRRRVICFLIGFQDRSVDDTITTDAIRQFYFTGTNSIRSWVYRMSAGAFAFDEAAVIGPVTVPWPYVDIGDQNYFSGLMQLARDRGFRLSSQDTNGNGIITSDELLIAINDCTNAVGGAQQRRVEFTFDGIRYSGAVFTTGLYTRGGPLQGPAQLENTRGTTCHELSHMLFGLPDRYYQVLPPRGDIVATAQRDGATTFEIAVDPRGAIRGGAQVRLRLAGTSEYVVFDDTARKHLNRGGSSVDANGLFALGNLCKIPFSGERSGKYAVERIS